MSKLYDAKQILKDLGLPKEQQNDRSALALLALCQLKESDSWNKAKAVSMAVVGNKANPRYGGVMRFISAHYGKTYAENSRETFRRQTLHQFEQAGIVEHNPENPSLPTNSKDNHYRLTKAALRTIQAFGTKSWNQKVERFNKEYGSLQATYNKVRKQHLIPIKLSNGKKLQLSAGKHNEVQAAIVKEFAARFANGGTVLYIGDTAKKDLYRDDVTLASIGVKLDPHSKLPDVIIYDESREWLFLIEAVTSHGPVSPKRIVELEKMFAKCKAGKIYVSAFPDRAEFRKHIADIAWETEVWIADNPSHMIHFNGDKFLGPR